MTAGDLRLPGDIPVTVFYDYAPPPPFAGVAEEQRSRAAEYNDLMSRWHSGEPMVAGELGIPRRVPAFVLKVLPEGPGEVEKRGLADVADGECRECEQERGGGVRYHRLEHGCERRDWEIKERFRPKVEVVRRQLPVRGSGPAVEATVWLKPGLS